MAGLCLINQTMAQCVGGSITSPNAEICVSTTTGIMTLSGHTGTIDQWEESSNGGGFWSIVNGSTTTHSAFPISTGTLMYRVKVTNGGSCYSSTTSVVVRNADGGTISTGGGTLCSGGSPAALTVTGHFTGSLGYLYWEYSTNGGSTYTLDGSGTNSNPYTPSSVLSSAGTYLYRAKASCGSSADDYSSNTKTYQVNSATSAAVCNDGDNLRKAVAKVTISGIPYSFSGFLVNHTSQDGRLLFLTTSHPFTRYSPNSTALNSATFVWNEDLNTCGGSAATTVTSVGCTLLVTDGFFTLLELNEAPALADLYYLGWDYTATGSYNSIFQSAASIKKGKVSSSSGPSANVTGSFGSGTDNFTESSGSGVFKFTTWSSGNTEKRGRGAPLLAGSVGKKVRGVYIGGDEANCGNGPSYFAELNSSLTSLLSYLRTGSESNTATVRMNYCKPSENLSGVVNISLPPYQVTGSIVSTQNIFNGFSIRYKAGTFVELNDGFVSGDDFVAEIDPCLITVTTIAAKTDDILEQPQPNTNTSTVDIKIYPTIIASGNALTIEVTESLQNVSVTLYDMQTKALQYTNIPELSAYNKHAFPISNLPSGLYFVRVQSNTISTTQKIIVR
jgi:hypothetical protein